MPRIKFFLFQYKHIKKDIEVFLKYAHEITQHQHDVIAVASMEMPAPEIKAQLEKAGVQLFLNADESARTRIYIIDTIIKKLNHQYNSATQFTQSALKLIFYKPIADGPIEAFLLEKSGLKHPPAPGNKENKKPEEQIKEEVPQEKVREEIPSVFLDPNTKKLIVNPVIARDGNTYDSSSVPKKIIKGNGEEVSTDQVYVNYFAKKMLARYLQDNTYLVPLDDVDCVCPLSFEPMVDPVLAIPRDSKKVIAHTYERREILKVVDRAKKTIDPRFDQPKKPIDPITKDFIKEDEFIPNLFAKDRIDAYRAALKLLDYVKKQDLNQVIAFLKPSIINVRNEENQNALHLAVQLNDDKISLLLIEKGINIHAKDEDGRTPLHYAVLAKKKEIIKKLIEKGANVNEKDVEEISPFDLAKQSQDKEIAKLFDKQESQKTVNKVLAEYTSKLLCDVSHRKEVDVVLHESSVTLGAFKN